MGVFFTQNVLRYMAWRFLPLRLKLFMNIFLWWNCTVSSVSIKPGNFCVSFSPVDVYFVRCLVFVQFIPLKSISLKYFSLSRLFLGLTISFSTTCQHKKACLCSSRSSALIRCFALMIFGWMVSRLNLSIMAFIRFNY